MLLLRAMIYGTLYQPDMWEFYANRAFPDLIASILGSSNSSAQARDFLGKRDTFSMNSCTEPAVVCADSVDADPSVITDVIFKEILNDTRAVSHTGMLPSHSVYARITEDILPDFCSWGTLAYTLVSLFILACACRRAVPRSLEHYLRTQDPPYWKFGEHKSTLYV